MTDKQIRRTAESVPPLPCPFCGGEQVFTAEGEDGWVHSEHSCDFVECESFSSEAEAIAAWNARAERTCRNKVIEINKNTPPEWRTDNFSCSECGAMFFADSEHVNYPIDWAYCPNCGAKVVDR